MSEYVKKLKEEPSFKQNGLNGYIYELQTKDMGLVLEDCFKGHDNNIV